MRTKTRQENRVPDAAAIAERAYQLFLARGGEAGGALADWLEAERQLAAERSPQEQPAARRKPPSAKASLRRPA